MSFVKKIMFNAMQAAPFILSNTIIFIPFLLFIDLSNPQKYESVLPFVLFYTFRFTGIFLLKSFKGSTEMFTVLILSIIVGVLGCISGLIAQFFFPMYYFSAAFLGLSAAWLPAANTTVKFHEKDQGFQLMKKGANIFIFLLFIILLVSLTTSSTTRMILILLEYIFLYIGMYYTISHYPIYKISFDELNHQMISIEELFLFIVFFILLLFVRLARMLFNTHFLMFGITGFSFFFLLSTWYFNRKKRKRNTYLDIDLLTFAIGMCNNFIFLFGTFYVAISFGSDKIVNRLYIPYVLGIVTSGFLIKKLYHLLPNLDSKRLHIFGLLFSFFILLFRNAFSFGIFSLTVFTNATGILLNQLYYKEESLPKDDRILTKYSVQMKGSICHQLILMTLLWFLTRQNGLPMMTELQITQHQPLDTVAVAIVEKLHRISILSLMICLIFLLNKFKKLSKD